MTSITENFYLPVLKGKYGEYKALSFLGENGKNKVRPLIEILPPDIDQDQLSVEFLAKHLKDNLDRIKKSWGDGKFFLDCSQIPEIDIDSKHIVDFIFGYAQTIALNVAPVVSLDESDNALHAFQDVISKNNIGALIRLKSDDFADHINDEIDRVVTALNIECDAVDLVIDFKYTPPSQTTNLKIAAKSILAVLPYINEWRSLIFVGTAFPENIASQNSGSIFTLPRAEWSIWKYLFTETSITRKPLFGDYGVTHPVLIDFDPVTMTIGAKIKYTLDDEWLVLKGGSLKKHGGGQYHTLSSQLISLPQYLGKSFSAGDAFIEDCAHKKCGPGNPGTWVFVSTSHHLEFVINQLSTIGAL